MKKVILTLNLEDDPLNVLTYLLIIDEHIPGEFDKQADACVKHFWGPDGFYSEEKFTEKEYEGLLIRLIDPSTGKTALITNTDRGWQPDTHLADCIYADKNFLLKYAKGAPGN